MKKLTWIAALLTALVLVVSGCPGGGDPIQEQETTGLDLAQTFSATGTTQDKATVNLTKDTVTFSFTGEELWGELITSEEARWDASAYLGIKFEYKASGNATIFAQDPNDIFIFATAGDGWGAIASADTWTELTLLFSILQNKGWVGNGSDAFDTSMVIKLMFQIEGGDEAKKFEIRNFTVLEGGVPSKAALIALIAEADAKTEADYTPASWATFAGALAEAKTIQAKTGATSEEIRSARTTLQTAMENLLPAGVVDKDALDALIAEAEEIDADGWTSVSWSTFIRAFNAAKSVSDASSSTQAEVDAAEEALQAAIDGLVERVEGDPHVIFDGSNGGLITDASVTVSSFVTATGTDITIIWNPADDPTNIENPGAFRANFGLTDGASIDLTGYTKFVMDWTVENVTGGSFNISLYFPGNRMLSKWVSSGTAEFDFTDDHPNWAAGTDWGGAEVGTITGFEIYSSDSGSFGSGNLVITKISFE